VKIWTSLIETRQSYNLSKWSKYPNFNMLEKSEQRFRGNGGLLLTLWHLFEDKVNLIKQSQSQTGRKFRVECRLSHTLILSSCTLHTAPLLCKIFRDLPVIYQNGQKEKCSSIVQWFEKKADFQLQTLGWGKFYFQMFSGILRQQMLYEIKQVV